MNTVQFAKLISFITTGRSSPLSSEQIITIRDLIAEMYVEAMPLNRLLNAMQRGAKIEAIKAYRELTGASLLDAKNAVEANWLTEQAGTCA